jgi:hypothetical protein
LSKNKLKKDLILSWHSRCAQTVDGLNAALIKSLYCKVQNALSRQISFHWRP